MFATIRNTHQNHPVWKFLSGILFILFRRFFFTLKRIFERENSIHVQPCVIKVVMLVFFYCGLKMVTCFASNKCKCSLINFTKESFIQKTTCYSCSTVYLVQQPDVRYSSSRPMADENTVPYTGYTVLQRACILIGQFAAVKIFDGHVKISRC